MTLDLSARQILAGQVDPRRCVASGVALRVLRDRSGRLEFAGLLGPRHKSAAPVASSSVDEDRPPVEFAVSGASVEVRDVATGTVLDLERVKARGSWTGRVVSLDEMTADLNGGRFELAAQMDRSRGVSSFEGQVRIRDAGIGSAGRSLAMLVPLVAPKGGNPVVAGNLSLDLYLKADGDSGEALAKTARGRGKIVLDGLDLAGSSFFDQVRRALPVPRGGVASLRGEFEIARRRATTENSVLNLASVPLELAGWTGFDGRIDYSIKTDRLGDRADDLIRKLPEEARQALADLSLEELNGLGHARITGTIDHPVVRASELARHLESAKDPAKRAEERARLRNAGRKILDRVFR